MTEEQYEKAKILQNQIAMCKMSISFLEKIIRENKKDRLGYLERWETVSFTEEELQYLKESKLKELDKLSKEFENI